MQSMQRYIFLIKLMNVIVDPLMSERISHQNNYTRVNVRGVCKGLYFVWRVRESIVFLNQQTSLSLTFKFYERERID